MKLWTRQVTTQKSSRESIHILKSCAYFFSKANFTESIFSMRCARRHNGRYLYLTRVKGTVSENKDHTIVILKVYASADVYLGAVIAVGGILGLIYCLMSGINRWIPYLGMVLLGLIFIGQALWQGAEVLDLIEHKLKTGDGSMP